MNTNMHSCVAAMPVILKFAKLRSCLRITDPVFEVCGGTHPLNSSEKLEILVSPIISIENP